MNIPGATYRIQFRNGMTFDRAAALVPYLQRLGITHLYASPVFTATSGSTHGYDVTDVNQLDPSIGGRAGFDRMVTALHSAGLGLILDIVPNHMAASLENPWWRDVIENGENSRFARHFDIDWSRRLTLPFLGDTFAALLENGEITVKPDPHSGKPAFACYDNFYPLTPTSWQGREAEVLNLSDNTQIAELHDRQPWRLMCWRDASHDLSYRRFFEVTGLAGMRVEDRAVFDDTHRLILELVDCGAVDGLRVDHIDGLADPKAYLDLLRQQAGPACYITVEKILGEGEHLPPEWPISGTTGYEFMAALTDALVDGTKINSLRKAYEAVVGRPVDMKAELRAAKLLMVDKNFAGEFTTLLKLATRIASSDTLTLDENTARAALRELLIAFPVYRTYGTPQGMTAADNQLLQKVANKVKASGSAPDPAALDVILRILRGEVSGTAATDAAIFRTRFQQLTGPLMAKSVEDTLFYRQNMALALNEVGAEPVPTAFSLDRFHAEMKTRLQQQPDALSGTSTHDTKRGEDARARLCTLTEAPQRWADCIARWREMNHASVRVLDDGVAPKPQVEWMLYQALAGVWPTTLQPIDETGLKALEERFVVYVEKALREAKQRTNWGDSNDAYEQAVIDYARQLLSPANQTFLQDFAAALQPFIRAGLVNSLTQTIVKLTAPGVPDIYQGSEALDFSLVDPDNRREPDFAALALQLAENEKPNFSAQPNWLNGRLNQHIIARLLRCRQHAPALFRHGDYLPLAASGQQAENVIAFARAENDDALIVIAPRLMFAALESSPAGPYAIRWPQTEIPLPARLANRRYRDILSGEEIVTDDHIRLALFEGSAAVILLSE
ncbi:(1-_4)-alpha-D-glucan 1-alpha-D-glucosylmutase [Erwinia toletana]|uniref:(1->4)-alpha-D-glucan 1-alpha-D-glucosylmutase n=1 Tax=Winslowiella toletana TaxID=92490 RepID=A0ABS4PEN2_9GAMM|nr:malto-oligosyltrehalose synthase [Winslowiella toletana]MBP2171099.1 (1->4)-alpha-D-glucan 1-alpha-D-glucosylmutase [Winslowiella toletana]